MHGDATMGEAKQKEVARSAVTDVHLTYGERLNLIQVFAKDRGKTTEERRKRRRVATALMLICEQHWRVMPVLDADGSPVRNQDGSVPQMIILGKLDGQVFKQLVTADRAAARLHEVTGETVEYVLKLLSEKGCEPGISEDVVLDLEERFLQVQRQEYVAPEGTLRAGECEEIEDLDTDPGERSGATEE